MYVLSSFNVIAARPPAASHLASSRRAFTYFAKNFSGVASSSPSLRRASSLNLARFLNYIPIAYSDGRDEEVGTGGRARATDGVGGDGGRSPGAGIVYRGIRRSSVGSPTYASAAASAAIAKAAGGKAAARAPEGRRGGGAGVWGDS